jgi:muramoyltetrapeptide carboxypeptidase
MMSLKQAIPYLQSGDLIRIIAPAKAIEAEFVEFAQEFLEKNGFRVLAGKHTLGRWNYLSGTDAERIADMQEALDDPECKAILCARGGYGSVRILEKLNWAGFLREPKWLIGFSDITFFHNHIQACDLPSIHATMPLNFKENTEESLNSLVDALSGNPRIYKYPAENAYFKKGTAEGKLVGGNLAVLHALMGTPKQPEFRDAILFIEDIGEYLYAIDRMLYTLELAGVFDKISGLILGGMTNISDTNPPLGFTLEEIIKEKSWYRSFPVCMNFPAGHIDDNRALVFGEMAKLEVEEEVIFRQG